ncbi:uncharacterized protein LOC103370404, partial [Stegastes partitus]|uniref:Uncharacterized protein LOC103370404 n=1 Tax=Stegastes partitus TaxID=144197 RepID=A0A9Y4NI29_9TELE
MARPGIHPDSTDTLWECCPNAGGSSSYLPWVFLVYFINFVRQVTVEVKQHLSTSRRRKTLRSSSSSSSGSAFTCVRVSSALRRREPPSNARSVNLLLGGMNFITSWRQSVKKNDSKRDAVQAQDIPDGPDSPSRLSVVNSPDLDPIITDFKLQLPDNKDALESANPSNGCSRSDLSLALEDCMAALDLFLRNDFEEAQARLRC